MNMMDYEGLTLEDLLKQKPDRKLLEKLLKKEPDETKRKKILDAIFDLEKH
jgi:hypothetical protein